MSVDTLFEILPFLIFAALSIVFGVGGLIASGIIAGLLAGIDVAAGLIASAVLSGKVEAKADATLLDVMPDKLALVRKRWDPFYKTLHQVVTKPQGVVINDDGICSTAAVGREVRPVTDVVVRSETYDDVTQPPTQLVYRVADAVEHAREFVAIAPATDRRPFEAPAADADPTLAPAAWRAAGETAQDGAALPESPPCTAIHARDPAVMPDGSRRATRATVDRRGHLDLTADRAAAPRSVRSWVRRGPVTPRLVELALRAAPKSSSPETAAFEVADQLGVWLEQGRLGRARRELHPRRYTIALVSHDSS